jgi:hypothetical protein
MDDPGTRLSTDKVRGEIARAQQLDVGDDPSLGAMTGMLAMFEPQLLALLPDDPEQLDALLLRGAEWALSLRSDTAERFAVLSAYGEPPS